jgi:hypothetical protein
MVLKSRIRVCTCGVPAVIVEYLREDEEFARNRICTPMSMTMTHTGEIRAVAERRWRTQGWTRSFEWQGRAAPREDRALARRM